MNTNDKEIHVKYLPTKPPVTFTAVVLLICDRFNAPGWVWGIVGSFLALCWIGAFMKMHATKWVKPSEI